MKHLIKKFEIKEWDVTASVSVADIGNAVQAEEWTIIDSSLLSMPSPLPRSLMPEFNKAVESWASGLSKQEIF